MTSPFKYWTGEAILPGDRVVSDDRFYGVVEWITLPNTELAEMEKAPDGGVTVAENVHGVVSYAFCSPSDSHGIMKSYRLEFIRRGSVISHVPGAPGGAPWPYETGPFGGGTKQDCGPRAGGDGKPATRG
jgi:hypothetical protein